MSRARQPRRTSASRPRRHSHRGRNLRYGLGLLGLIGFLFGMALQAHELDQLQSERTRLAQQSAHEEDEYRRLIVKWYRATRRDRILPRAFAELSLAEPGPEDKEVVALRVAPEPGSPQGLLHQLRRGLDRYGEIRSAVAGEDAP